MENRNKLLEVAHKYLETKQKCSFEEIWQHIKKEFNIGPDTSLEKQEKIAGNLFTGMVLDPFFFYKNDRLWYPRSEVPLDEIKTQITATLQSDEKEIDDEFDLEEEVAGDSDSHTQVIILEDDYDDESNMRDDDDIEEIFENIELEEDFSV